MCVLKRPLGGHKNSLKCCRLEEEKMSLLNTNGQQEWLCIPVGLKIQHKPSAPLRRVRSYILSLKTTGGLGDPVGEEWTLR